MRQKQRPPMTAMRRATARCVALAGLLLLFVFVVHHGIAAASDHPLDVLGTHDHSDHHDAPHDHDPHTEPVGQPKRIPRWAVAGHAPDIAPPSLVATAEPVAYRLLTAALPEPDASPALSGADWRVLFQTFLI